MQLRLPIDQSVLLSRRGKGQQALDLIERVVDLSHAQPIERLSNGHHWIGDSFGIEENLTLQNVNSIFVERRRQRLHRRVLSLGEQRGENATIGWNAKALGADAFSDGTELAAQLEQRTQKLAFGQRTAQ
jgi:hypothetical protein